MVDRTNPIHVSTLHAYVNRVDSERALYVLVVTGFVYILSGNGTCLEG